MGLVIRCDRCGYTMRTAKGKKRRFASIAIESDERPLFHVKVFSDVLETLIPGFTNGTDEGISQALLLADNISITYDINTFIVSQISFS